MSLIKNKKAALKFSFLILGLITIVAIIVYAGGVFATGTHTSNVTVTPPIVPNASSVDFTADVEWTSGDSIHEFRVYEPLEFSDLHCDSVSNWYDPFYAHTTINGTEYYYCQWSAKPGYVLDAANPQKDFTFSLNTAETECCRKLFVETRDDHGIYVFHEPDVCVDTSAPTTTKTFDGPQKLLNCPGPNCVEWIDSITLINLTAKDPIPHPSGIDKTYYKNILAADILKDFNLNWSCEEDPCRDVDLCENLDRYVSYGDNDWQNYFEPFSKHDEPESCHILYYYSEDNVGNKEEIKTNCFFVDKTAPIVSKKIGEPTYGDCPGGVIEPIPCGGWTDCGVITEKKDFFTTGRQDPSNWDLAIWEYSGGVELIRAQEEYSWGSNQEVAFSVSYDPSDGSVEYTVGDETLTWTYDSGKAFGYIVAFAKGNADGNSVKLTNMALNGQALPDVDSGNTYKGVKVPLSDADQVNGFTITGKAKLIWAGSHPQEIPAFHIFAMETHTPTQGDCWLRDDHLIAGTPITLTCEDQQPHPSNDVTIYYRILLDGQESDGWTKYTDPIVFHEDSEHTLQYYCEDAVEKSDGTRAEPHEQTYKVDSVPPEISKEMIGTDHMGDCPPKEEGDECYVRDDGQNGVAISVVDPDPTGMECNVGVDYCTYGLWWEYGKEECKGEIDDGWCLVDGGEFSDYQEIFFTEDSTHELHIYCVDALGNEVYDEEEFLVDSTPPTTTKTYGEPTEVEGAYRWITSDTEITLTAEDVKVGVDEIYWRNTLLDIPDQDCVEQCQCGSPLEEVFDLTGDVEGTVTKTDSGDSFTWTVSITSDNPAHHVWGTGMAFATSTDQPAFQVYFAEFSDNMWHYQDYGTGWNGPDTTTLPAGILTTGNQNGQVFTITIPKSKLGGACSTFYWATQARTNLRGKYPSTWDQWSGGSHEVSGMESSVVGGSGKWNIYEQPFYKPEESCHLIEFYAIDKLGNEETINRQCVYVDNTPPEPTKTISGPEEDAQYPVHKYLTSESTIRIECIDQSPHPVGNEIIHWEMHWKEDNCEVDDNWEPKGSGQEQSYKEFTNLDDSCHKFVYWCSDILGNVEPAPHKEIDIVDNKAPEINKTIIGPRSGDCPPEPGSNDICYIDGITNITVNVIDPEPHPVDQVTCEWSYTVNDDTPIIGGEGLGSSFIVHFPEESEHDLTITCRDALGNTATDVETFFVDKTAPTTTKEYIGPYFEDNGTEWIDGITNISLTVEDTGLHKSGIKETKYRVTLVDDDYCWDNVECQKLEGSEEWQTYTEPFNDIEESCHLIEYYSVDNVDKVEPVNKQCVFVDKSAPEPNKTVGEPYTEWYPVDVAVDPFDPDATHFYPEIVDKCWNGQGDQIECWKVTTDTKITLDCVDPEPHPVGHEEACFQVELDAEDATEDYCSHVGGNYNKYGDGFCCGMDAPYEFKFKEETEHNLKYYCVDAVEKKGPVDEEKFKVMGKMFNIRLNDKWNLISAPFVLLNDSPQEVFEDASSVQTVWSYDGGTKQWYVYREGENYTNNLEHIEPGLGYWVLADCEKMDEMPIDGQHGCGKDDKCEMLVIGGSLYQAGPVVPPSQSLAEGWNLIGYYGTEGRRRYKGPDADYYKNSKEAYCALYSLRNLNDGFVSPTNWNALVGYWEPDNPHQWEEYGMCDELDPGAGYWIAMDKEDLYNRETVCDQSILEELYCFFT